MSADELLDLERARITLRARGISVDRGRLVREAIALLLADLNGGIDSSLLARRLREPTTDCAADDGHRQVPAPPP